MYPRMVEPQSVLDLGERRRDGHCQEPTDHRHSSRALSDFYDTENSATPSTPDCPGGKHSNSRSSMQGDASNRVTPVRPRPDANRRRQSNTAPVSRPAVHPSTIPAPGYFPSYPPGPSPDPLLSGGRGFPGPTLHYPPAGSSYPQSTGYYGQYTLPTPTSLSMVQASPYTYTHGHSPNAPEGNLVQANYQPMVPPQYHYQQRPPDDAVNANPLTTSSSAFSSHVPSMSPIHTPSGTLSPTYMGPNHFPYPSPLSNRQYTYPQRFSPSPPVYSLYGPLLYPQHAPSPQEKAPGTWVYVAHGTAPPQQYHYDGSQYQNAYTPQYPSLMHHQNPAFFPSLPSGSEPSTSRNTVKNTPPPTPAVPTSPATSSLIPSRPASAGSKPVARREWHPRPPPHRSPWVMWVGNVPSDATQEELWTFFSVIPGALPSDGDLVSIFPIARSSCAFINYANEANLEAAIQAFNGLRLRPNDPQCPMLVCKIRRSTDDLKSGVGGQRGIGLHKQWVKEQRKLQNQVKPRADLSPSVDTSLSPQSTLDDVADGLASVSFSGPQHRSKHPDMSSSSESYGSTTSSLLSEHFSTRYFILKSLSERDLELSVQSGLWATQNHNELVLDRAYRTATNVFLIFSVNKSGEFYGYARMAGPIREGEGNVSWSQRSRPQSSSSPLFPSFPPLPQSKMISDSRLLSSGPVYQSPEDLQLTDESQAMQHDAVPMLYRSFRAAHDYQSAPALLGRPDGSPTKHTPSLKFSLDHHQRRQQTPVPKAAFRLDPNGPFRAMRGPLVPLEELADGGVAEEPRLKPVDEARENAEEAGFDKPSTWGDCFKVEWLERQKISFHRTRHLRNAWNKSREIKVSRDGTELESSVGKRLLEEWRDLAGS